MHSESFSNHGSEKGTWERFFFQVQDIAKVGGGQKEFDSRSGDYFNKAMHEITHFYDVYHRLIDLIEKFKAGVSDGKYYSVTERGSSTFDRSLELEIRNLVKDFFARGKIMLTSFAKSGLLEDVQNGFSFNDFYFCDKKKFDKRAEEYVKRTDGRHLSVIKLLDSANDNFLQDFNKVRGMVEHELFRLDPFEVNHTNPRTLTEPQLNGGDLSYTLSNFYESILDFIEKAPVYFYGINTELRTNGMFLLHERKEYNYSFPSAAFKYTLSMGPMGILYGGEAVRCGYD